VQGFLETEGMLLVGKGFVIFSLAFRTEWQATTLYDGYRGSVTVGLSQQTQGVGQTLLCPRRFGDLFGLSDDREQEISVASMDEVIDGENLSIEEQELEMILLHYLAGSCHLERGMEQAQGVTQSAEKKVRAGDLTEGIDCCGIVSVQFIVCGY
jgi:hypothetical protein